MDLQIEEDIAFQKRQWVVQRFGRYGMYLFVLAAALGFFGEGILSQKKIQHGILEVDYERFSRFQKNSIFKIKIAAQNSVESPHRTIWINNDFLKDIKIENIDPQPSHVQADSLGHNYIFETSKAGEALSVFFHFRYQRPGSYTALIRTDEKSGEVFLRQLVYP